MKNTKSCPKCGSTDIVRIPDNPNRHASGNNIYTSTYTLFGKIPVIRYVFSGDTRHRFRCLSLICHKQYHCQYATSNDDSQHQTSIFTIFSPSKYAPKYIARHAVITPIPVGFPYSIFINSGKLNFI